MVLFDKFLRPFNLSISGCFMSPPGGGNNSEETKEDGNAINTTTLAHTPTTEAGAVYTTALSITTQDTMLYTNVHTPAAGLLLRPTTTTEGSKTLESVPLSPLDDPRVSWIHNLKKEELIPTMQRFGLETEGRNLDQLRKDLKAFWKEPLGLASKRQVSELVQHHQNIIDQSSHNVGHEARPPPRLYGDRERLDPTTTAMIDELGSVREILRLSPNADAYTVRQTLASLVRKEERREDTRLGPVLGLPVPLQPPPMSYRVPALNTETSRINRPHEEHPHVPDVSQLCNTVRKWNLRFDGRKDPISFLERLDELIEAYEMHPSDILRALPEILAGPAILWYRNTREHWKTYEDFRHHFECQFLPPGYRRKLSDEIRKRTQGENEPFRDFVTSLTTLIRRRGYSTEQERLDLLYSNMKPDYKLVVRRQEFRTLAQMCSLAESYEEYLRDRTTFRPPPPPSLSLVPETAYFSKKRGDRWAENAGVESRSEPKANPEPRERKVAFDENPSTVGDKPPSWEHRRAVSDETSRYQRRTPETSFVPRSKNKSNEDQRSKVETRDEAATTSSMGWNSASTQSGHRNSRVLSSNSGRQQQVDSTADVRKTMTCWNCESQGHLFRDCPKPKKLRCFNCKTEGIATTKCSCHLGNGARAQM